MDGFEANEGIIIIAATNRPDVLDPALLRPGRFDRQVVVPNPDVTGREKIIRVHMRNVPLAADVDVKTIARGTPGFSGADLMNLVNEAALFAARRNKKMVSQHDFEQAKDKVMMGAERKSMAMTEEEKKLTAYHEGGHAILALSVPSTDPVHKATIIPRGRALGMVMQLPEGDRYSMKYQQMTSRLVILMGGRVAEEIVFGKENITSGASSDIEQATKLAKAMVTRWGYSEALGLVAYGDNQDEVFLGMSMGRTQAVSDETAKTIDAEVKRLVHEGYESAKRILSERREDLETLAKALLEYETLSGDEIIKVIQGIPPVRESNEPKAPSSVSVPLTHASKPLALPARRGARAGLTRRRVARPALPQARLSARRGAGCPRRRTRCWCADRSSGAHGSSGGHARDRARGQDPSPAAADSRTRTPPAPYPPSPAPRAPPASSPDRPFAVLLRTSPRVHPGSTSAGERRLSGERSAAVVRVAHRLQPRHRLAALRKLQRHVRHPDGRRGAVPVPLAGSEPDDVARPQLLARAAFSRRPSESGGDQEGLAERVRVPARTRARLEGDGGRRRPHPLLRRLERV